MLSKMIVLTQDVAIREAIRIVDCIIKELEDYCETLPVELHRGNRDDTRRILISVVARELMGIKE